MFNCNTDWQWSTKCDKMGESYDSFNWRDTDVWTTYKDDLLGIINCWRRIYGKLPFSDLIEGSVEFLYLLGIFVYNFRYHFLLQKRSIVMIILR